MMTLLEQHHELLEEATDALGIGRVTGDGDLVAAHEDLHGKTRSRSCAAARRVDPADPP